MIVKNTGSNYEAPPAGTHVARCISLIGIGTREKEWQGQKRLASEIVVIWELPFETDSEGKPFTISAFYTRSLADKANLRHALKNWRGRDFTPDELQAFEMKNVLDKGCQVVCTENDKGKVYVTSVAGMPKGVVLPDRVNDLRYFDAEEWDAEGFELLSDGMKKLCQESFEYAEMQNGEILDSNERFLLWKESQKAPQMTGQPQTKAAPSGVDDDDPDSIPF